MKVLHEYRLKPCPFCGKSDTVELIEVKFPRKMYSVGCSSCHIGTDFNDSEEWVVYVWNGRVKE